MRGFLLSWTKRLVCRSSEQLFCVARRIKLAQLQNLADCGLPQSRVGHVLPGRPAVLPVFLENGAQRLQRPFVARDVDGIKQAQSSRLGRDASLRPAWSERIGCIAAQHKRQIPHPYAL